MPGEQRKSLNKYSVPGNVVSPEMMGPAPKGITRPHRHHILSLNGRAGEERALVREGQDILRGVDIDPLHGIENLTWAPNKGHTIDVTRTLVGELRAAQQAGAGKRQIVRILRQFGDEARGR